MSCRVCHSESRGLLCRHCWLALCAAPEHRRFRRHGDPISEIALATWARRVVAEALNGSKP